MGAPGGNLVVAYCETSLDICLLLFMDQYMGTPHSIHSGELDHDWDQHFKTRTSGNENKLEGQSCEFSFGHNKNMKHKHNKTKIRQIRILKVLVLYTKCILK